MNMENPSSFGHCPCCQAPLQPSQDESQLVCSRCGAKIILKQPLDQRIERIAFARVLTLYLSPSMLLVGWLFTNFLFGWLVWRFLLRDTERLQEPLVLYGLVAGGIAWNAIVLWSISSAQRMKACADGCGHSLERLRSLVRIQPTRERKYLLREVERYIQEMHQQLDM